MAGLFYKLYLFNRKNPIFPILTGLLLIVFGIYSFFSLKFNEDILDLVPSNKKIDQVGNLLKNLKINNRLTIHIYTENKGVSKDSIIDASDEFSESLKQADAGKAIRSLAFSWGGDDNISDLYNYYYKYLPFYLSDSVYASLDKRMENRGIEKSLESTYKSLISPLGTFSGKFAIKDPLGLTGIPLQGLKDLSVSENLKVYRNHLISEDGKHLLGFIELIHPTSETEVNGELIERINEVKLEIEARYDARVEYFGAAAVAVANANQIRKDIYLTLSLAAIFLVTIVLLFFGGFLSFIRIITPGLFGILTGIIFINILDDEVSIIAIAIGSVLLGITIDFALHILIHRKEDANVERLFKSITQPLLICGITTATAFLSLLFLDSSAMNDLGIFAAISTFTSSVYALIALPLIIPENLNRRQNFNRAEKLLERIARYKYHKSWYSWILLIGVSVLSIFYWKDVRFESDMMKLNYMPDSLDAYSANLNRVSDIASNTLYLATVDSTRDAALTKNAPLDSVLALELNNNQILSFVSFNQLVPSKRERSLRMEKWNSFWEKQDRELIAKRVAETADSLGFAPGTFNDFISLIKTDSLALNRADFETVPNTVGNGALLIDADSSKAIISFIRLLDSQKSDLIDRIQQVPFITILDKGYLTNQLVEILKENFGLLVNISLVAVFAILLLSYGRIELAIMAYIPVILSWFWVLGIMGFFNLGFNIANIIICTFIFGLGIDYSVFQLKGYLHEYQFGTEKATSFRKSIILSMLTTITGMGVMIFAEHPALKSIALLAIIGMVSVVFITFVVQPLIFDFLIGKRKTKGVVPFTLLSLFHSFIAFSYFLFGCALLNLIRLILTIPVGNIQKKKYAFHCVIQWFSKSLIYLMMNVRKDIRQLEKTNFENPSVIIANHHSFIDILVMLMLSPKVVMVTNKWVYRSPFFGAVVRYADFIPAMEGVENQLDKMRQLVSQGYSIIVFPEGTRSRTHHLSRFHKGAFFLAEALNLDIQPVLIHGTAMVMSKGDDFYLKSNKLTLKFLDRIELINIEFGNGYRERSKLISKHFKNAFNLLRGEVETPYYFKELLIKNYIYKGPVLEWYLRIKLKFEKYYEPFHELIPKGARVVDLGGGYGFMAQTLAFSDESRDVKSFDYDDGKVSTGNSVPCKPHNLTLKTQDVIETANTPADVFILSDVLHYLKPGDQSKLLERMEKNLREAGKMIIRDGDSNLKKRHKGSVFSEWLSTRIGFNKTRNGLNFISSDFIRNFAQSKNLKLTEIDNSKRTSNLIFVLEKR